MDILKFIGDNPPSTATEMGEGLLQRAMVQVQSWTREDADGAEFTDPKLYIFGVHSLQNNNDPSSATSLSFYKKTDVS